MRADALISSKRDLLTSTSNSDNKELSKKEEAVAVCNSLVLLCSYYPEFAEVYFYMDFEKEIKRSEAVQKVAKTIIDNGSLALQAKKHFDEYGIEKNVEIPLLGIVDK